MRQKQEHQWNRIGEAFKLLAMACGLIVLVYFLMDRGSNALLINAQETAFSPTDLTAERSSWTMDESGWYYTKEDGTRYASCWAEVDGVRYYFRENGAYATGLTDVGGKIMYFDKQGQALTEQWVHDGEGRRYRLGADGEAVTGWFTDTDGRRYHMDTGGLCDLGPTQIEGAFYCFSPDDGHMLTGLQKVRGLLYDLGPDGRARSGWQTISGRKYFFSDSGAAYTGWHYMDDQYYYFSQEGIYDPSREFTEGPRVALTFDDGPGEYTHQILDLLVSYNAKATFFMLGKEIERRPDEVLRESQLGMELGNHSWDHPHLKQLSDEDIRAQIGNTNALVESITGHRPTVFRPPGGGYDERVIANSYEMPLIMWTIDTLDWETRDPQTTYNIVMEQVRDGAIILLHEIHPQTLEAIRMIVPDLLQKGYQLVTVTELAEAKGITLHTGEIYTELS